MLEWQQELLRLTADVRTLFTQDLQQPLHVETKQPRLPPAKTPLPPVKEPAQQQISDQPIEIEEPLSHQTPTDVSFPHLRHWAQGLFHLSEPLTPIVCLGDHPLLAKLATAMTEKFLPTMCCTHLPPLDHPLLKLILIPTPLTLKLPELKHLAHLKPHDVCGPVLLLHPLEVYLHHAHEKRLLWNIIQKLPLFC